MQIECAPHSPCLRDASRRSLATNTLGHRGTKVAKVKVFSTNQDNGVETEERANIESSQPHERDESALLRRVAEEGRGVVEEEAALLGGGDGRGVGERVGKWMA